MVEENSPGLQPWEMGVTCPALKVAADVFGLCLHDACLAALLSSLCPCRARSGVLLDQESIGISELLDFAFYSTLCISPRFVFGKQSGQYPQRNTHRQRQQNRRYQEQRYDLRCFCSVILHS
jgi:hypothetical protein